VQLTGDFAGLKRFEDKLRAAKNAYDALPDKLSEQAITLTRMGFRRATDPYGAGWKGTWRGGRILQKSGNMFGSIYRRHTSRQFSIGVKASYASTHQNGAVIRAKNSKQVEFTRRNPRKRNAKGNLKKRKGKWSSAGRSGGQSFGDTHMVSYMRTALCFKIGKQWISKQSVTIPRRMMVPTAGRGLPHTWSTAFQRTVNQKLKRHFK